MTPQTKPNSSNSDRNSALPPKATFVSFLLLGAIALIQILNSQTPELSQLLNSQTPELSQLLNA